MKRVLFITHTNCAVDLVVVLSLSGYEVDVVVTDLEATEVGKGFDIKIVQGLGDFERIKDKYDFFVVDDVYFGNIANKLRREGKIVCGGSVDTDIWENNRDVGMEVMKRSGIKVSEVKRFASYEEAIEFVKKDKDMWVLKYSGVEGTVKGKTVVPVVKEELEWYLKEFEGEGGGSEFILQRMVKGVEVAFSWWWNGEDVVGDVFMNFEHKRMFDGNMGALCGESGTVVVSVSDRIVRERFGGVFDFLRSSGYRGIVDINTVYDVEEKEFYGLEWTPRFGYPIMQCITRMYLNSGIDIGEVIRKVASGEKKIEMVSDKNKYGVVVGYFVTGKPDNVPIFVEGLDIERDLKSCLGLDDVRYDREQGCFVAVRSASGSWYRRVIVGVGCGSDVDEGIKKSYEVMKRMRSTYGWYRTDIGQDIKEKLKIMEGLV